MTNNLKKVRIILIVMMAMVLLLPVLAKETYAETANSGNFETTKYNMSVLVNEDHSYSISESITVIFDEDRRFFDVKIPADKKEIENINVENHKFTVIESDDEYTVRISETAGVIDEAFDIELSYVVYEYADDLSTKDMFYLELIPYNWGSKIDAAVIGIVLPKDFNYSNIECYADQYGAAISGDLLDVKILKDESKIIISGTELTKGTGISVKADLPQGYWQGEINNNWAVNYVYYVLISLMALIVILWFFLGRDPTIEKTVEYYPPEAMTPPEVGYLMDGEIGKKDIISMLFYLADKRHIKIVEYERKKFKIVKNREPRSEKRYIRQAVHAIFGIHNEVDVNEITHNLGRAHGRVANGIEDQFESGNSRVFTKASEFAKVLGCFILAAAILVIGIFASIYSFNTTGYLLYVPVAILVFTTSMLTAAEYDKIVFARSAKTSILMATFVALLMIVLIVFTIFITNAFDSIFIGLTMLLCIIVSMVFICWMKARTKQNAMLLARVLGFRKFISKPDLEIVLKLSRENPLYFYDILPYAYTFGLTSVWTKTFDIVKVESPEWFEPYEHFEQRKYSLGINTVRFNTVLNDFSRNFANKMGSRDDLKD
ncbi:MAG: DUF2207 domain-containing protein [Peptostreptococcaceae bacterium]|nr:DUF2207 domain-containing protein [Peptostreptococcaceae bacterium]